MVIFPVDLGFPYNLLNIPTNPHNMVIFPVGFPYNLQRAKFPTVASVGGFPYEWQHWPVVHCQSVSGLFNKLVLVTSLLWQITSQCCTPSQSR